MKKQRFHYSISGYRWAPESFRVWKELAGQPKREVPLTSEERSEMAHRFFTKGFWDAIGYVKHIERKYAHKQHTYMTYGFRAKESASHYIYSPQLQCRADTALSERLRIFKKLRRHLEEVGGRVEISTECELDGNYNPTHIKRNVVTADFSRPLRIWLTARQQKR